MPNRPVRSLTNLKSEKHLITNTRHKISYDISVMNYADLFPTLRYSFSHFFLPISSMSVHSFLQFFFYPVQQYVIGVSFFFFSTIIDNSRLVFWADSHNHHRHHLLLLLSALLLLIASTFSLYRFSFISSHFIEFLLTSYDYL